MEKEIGIEFPGSCIGDSDFYDESAYEQEQNDDFVQEFTLAEVLLAGSIAGYLSALGSVVFKICAGGKRVYKFAAKMVEAKKNNDSKNVIKYLKKLSDALALAGVKSSLTSAEKKQLSLTSHIGLALWLCLRNPTKPLVKETSELFEKYMVSCLEILANPDKGRTVETIDMEALSKESDDD